ILRIIIEKKLDLNLMELLDLTIKSVKQKVADVSDDLSSKIYDFMMERLRTYYHDQGVSLDMFDAVLVRRPSSPLDFDRRIFAISEFQKLPEAQSLAAANKRIRNILKKVDGAVPDSVNDEILVESAEKDLAHAVNALSETVLPLLDKGDYNKAMTQLAGLRAPVDSFFDSVMVMDDDIQLRNNRLALLNQMNILFLRVADLSRLQS
ncbi:MAG TPA: glycine--tRNA ligase subunit beta, partial [Gammaproteobacteria bacterium]|nr:glycine--tRNA ligase subunit beta [Gammaproteobacteria bacterium]